MKWKCKECKKESVIKVKKAIISIQYPRKAIEIVADNICIDCLKESLKSG